MDGDEGRSGTTAVCDGGTRDEATASGDAASAPMTGARTAEGAVEPSAEEAPPAEGSAAGAVDEAEAVGEQPAEETDAADDAAADDAALDDVAADDEAPDDAAPDDVAPDAPASDDDGVASADEAVPAAATTAIASTDPAPRLRRPYLRRGLLALAAAGFVALAVGAFSWSTPSPESADQRFVEAVQSQGHVLAPGEQETLVVSAARKICDRRVIHDTDQERRATALTTEEIAAVGTAFGADTRAFTTLALETYCSS